MKRDVRILLVAGALAFAGYVALNVAVLAFAPMLHRLRCDVRVVDVERRPVSGVAVTFVSDGGALRGTHVVTDARGEATLELVFQEQCAWAFPRLGDVDPRVSVARIGARSPTGAHIGPVSARDPRTRVELVVDER